MAIKYLQKYGLRVVDNGYDICFIRPGEKRPFGKDWEDTKHGPKRIASAIEAGRGAFGVGIKAKHTPLVDIDCYDEDLVAHMARFVKKTVGQQGLKRIGFPPKMGIMFRASEPFPKTQSKVFIDDEGRQVKLEVLGDGQQFVAYHIHPDTEQPYDWLTEGPLDVPHDELVDLDRDDAFAFVAEFEAQCRARGWMEKSTVKRLAGGKKGAKYNYDDPFITDKSKVDLTSDQLLKKLHAVPNADDYDTWFHVGMALHHQFDGADEGLTMWHEWSQSASNYDMDALDEKWPTFEIEGKKREPLTARFIIKQAQEESERLAGEEFDEVKDDIRNADDFRTLQAVMDRIKGIAFPPMLRENLAGLIKERMKVATGSVISLPMVRKQIAFENPENRATPAWLRDWVFVQLDDTFYNSRTRQTMSTKGFDLSFGRFLLTKKDILEGVTVPEASASNLAVNRYQIPAVSNKMYAPLEDALFTANNMDFVNSYSNATVPEMPDELNRKQRRIVGRIEKHLEHLFRNERDRKLLLSWLAYIVQSHGKVNWSPVIQGVENDGKSFFGRMMAVVLGGENVNMIIGEQLAEQYTGWAEGSQFLMIEEVRLHGMDRYAVINKLKTYVANDMVTIRRMRTDSYKVINTVNYFLTTNHKDGVPVNDTSSRYFPMFSRWQTKRALALFNKANPDYYKELHEVLEHAGALRRWLMDYELHEEFDPVNRATESASLAEMKYLNQTDEEEGLAAILDQEVPGVNRDLLDSSALADAMADAGVPTPYGQAWKRMLSEAGFTFLGVAKWDGKARKWWSQNPDRFVKDDGKIDTHAIADELDPI